MTAHTYHLHDSQGGAALAVRVTPRASRNEVAEVLHDGTVRIRLTASLSEPNVNQNLVLFLAEILDIPDTNIEVVAGQSGKDKLVSVLNIDAETVHQRILARL